MTSILHTFSALADETRLGIVEQLMTQGELPAGDLVGGSGISAPAISRHLKVLRNAGVIQQRVDGTRRIYSARPEALRMIADWTMARREFWSGSLDRLDAELLQEKDPS